MFSARTLTSSLRAAPRAATAVSRGAGVAVPALRTYATAAEESSYKPPVPLYGIDGTYANALYTASAKSSSLDSVAAALNKLHKTFKSDPKLTTILSSPTLTVEDKAAITKELARVAGGAGKDGILANFLTTLAENNRLGSLEGVCEKFAVLMSAFKGEVELVITSAQELDQKSLRRLETAVSKSEFSQGKKLKVVTKINHDLLGGLIVEIGDRTIDLSISSKIAKLNKALTDAV
ncbi:ATPase, F1 complex, OSCP/delta subunit [Ascosphaera apis ARSEF 7405]|uniref:ATP synthase subunit 5, mitochondrial n=1 Tax=Ascosphaera apis ARSEF 7405 TaxID=392613 RepID=A0A168AKF1_9EURO|nr:ATPase, F1 complex, OSCP/delta subunit [Ascosphaera apis ARSEF 7405]